MADLLKSMAEADRPAYLKTTANAAAAPAGVATASPTVQLAVQMTAERAADREAATILAALRFWQRHEGHINRVGSFEEDIATDGGRWEPLDGESIDALCERLNTEG